MNDNGRGRFRALSLLCFVAALSASACSGDGPSAPPVQVAWYFPASDATWARVSPSQAGFDSVALESALDWAAAQESFGVVLLWRGRIVTERYTNSWVSSTRYPVYSAGKTITSALITQMVAEGRLSLDQSVTSIIGAGWSRATSGESAITVRHLLSMVSGLDDSLKTVTGAGSSFYYNNPAYYQLFAVLESVSGLSTGALASNRLFSRIGMTRALSFANEDTGEPGHIFLMSARDFARFGLLVLRHGRWGTDTILADSAALAQSRRYSGTTNQSYGWLWWLNGGISYRTPGPSFLPTVSGPLIPSAPADLVAALGADDKKLYVVPSMDLVVVRLGDRAPVSGAASPAAISTFDNALWTRLMAARILR